MSSSSTPIYAAKSTIRTLKNFSKGYTDMQAKVREATSNDPWGPSGTQMNELARATFDQQYFIEIMEILDKRMNDKGKNWRHVFKALTVLDYLLHVGSENVVRYARDNLYIVKTLKEFQFIDEDGKDQGSNVRQKAKDITALLSDEGRLKEERRSRSAMRDRMIGRAPGEGRPYDSTTPVYERPGMGDDDRDLQKALEESRRTARDTRGSNSDDDDLKKALELSKKEEQDRQRNVEKSNELSHTEEWESRPNSGGQQNQEQTNNTDFFANDFGGSNNNNNGFDAASAMNNSNNNLNNDNAFLQSQPTGFNNPYMQFQQQQLQQQQMMQEQMMQQQQLALQQQQQQQAFMMSQMNNQYQQQVMPQMTGAPAIGSNNPFSAQNIQKASANQPFPDSFRTGASTNGFGNNMNNNSNNNNNNGANGFGGGFNYMGNSNPVSTNNNSSLGELAFLQNAMTPAAPANTQPQAQPATKAPNAHDEKYAHLATALSNREDGMDTFGNSGQLRVPSHHTLAAPVALTSHITGASNPFQRSNLNNPNSSLIGIGNNNTNFTGNSNPFQTTSQAGGFNSNGFGGMAMNANGATNNGAFSSNTLF